MSEIIIKNCNSIDNASINIEIGRLNIKYGINGTGKSTIAKAINHHNSLDLKSLLPFKYRESNPNNIQPSISGVEDYSSIIMFNEDYIDQFIFREDEVVKNSFEIFIKDEKYQENLDAIEELFFDVKNIFNTNDTLTKVIKDLDELSNSFSNNSGGMARNSQIYKALANGNKIENIPEGLEEYSEYLKSEQNTEWIKWQTSGSGFLEISNKCPYCTSSIENKKETIQRVATEYDDKSIAYLLKILNIMVNLNTYFTEDTQKTIENITKNRIGISDLESDFLKRIKIEIDALKSKLQALQHLAYFTFSNLDNMVTEINKFRINLELVPALNSPTTQQIIEPLHASLDSLITKAGILKGKIIQQKRAIGSKINEYQDEINAFLKFAGYKYTITIEETNQEFKMKLQHFDLATSVKEGNKHLSYGEKNAFALMLFMYDCLSKEPDLIILDDPISSFDKNKKFAIIEMLFRGEKSFKNKTVLMLTHDFDPIVDIVLHHSDIFNVVNPHASFLENIEGVLSERIITSCDIKTFLEIAKENISSLDETINKLIYLRRLHEITNNKGLTYQLLSNIFHKREVPQYKSPAENRNMTEDEISEASQEIQEAINETFDYLICYQNISNNNELLRLYDKATNNYEKLQIYRVLHNDNHHNRTIRKFINETFHIENDYIYQLNPCQYQTIPYYIIKECNQDIDLLKSTTS